MLAASASRHPPDAPCFPTCPSRASPPPAQVPSPSRRSSGSSVVSVYHETVEYQPGGDADRETEAHSSHAASPQSATSTSATSAPEDVWSYSQPVPGSKKKLLIYPKARFEWGPWTALQCADRFRFVAEQLSSLVHKYLRLDDFENRPTYSPRMVGTCPSNARLSVVVTCRDADFKNIRKLFRSRALQPLCLDESAAPPRRLPFSRSGRESEASVPRLLLVYYRTRTGPVV